jgi:hypothetical protein
VRLDPVEARNRLEERAIVEEPEELWLARVVQVVVAEEDE